MATYLLLTFSVSGQYVITNLSQLPYTLTVVGQDEVVVQYKDLSAATGYRTRRLSWSNVLAYVNANLNGNGANLTNLVNAPVVIAGSNTIVSTNIVAGTGQKTYTVNSLTDSNILKITISNAISGAVKSSDYSVNVASTNMANIPELSVSLSDGIWECKGVFWVTNYVAVGGADSFWFNFSGGSAAISGLSLTAIGQQSDVNVGLVGLGSIYSSTAVFPIISGAIQDAKSISFSGVFHLSAGGSVIPKVRAEAGDGTSTEMKVLHDSYMIFTKIQ